MCPALKKLGMHAVVADIDIFYHVRNLQTIFNYMNF